MMSEMRGFRFAAMLVMKFEKKRIIKQITPLFSQTQILILLLMVQVSMMHLTESKCHYMKKTNIFWKRFWLNYRFNYRSHY